MHHHALHARSELGVSSVFWVGLELSDCRFAVTSYVEKRPCVKVYMEIDLEDTYYRVDTRSETSQ